MMLDSRLADGTAWPASLVFELKQAECFPQSRPHMPTHAYYVFCINNNAVVRGVRR